MSPHLTLLTHLPQPKLHPKSQTRKQKPQDRCMWPVLELPPHSLSRPRTSSLGWGAVGESPSPPRNAGGQGRNLRKVGTGEEPEHPQMRDSVSIRTKMALGQNSRKTPSLLRPAPLREELSSATISSSLEEGAKTHPPAHTPLGPSGEGSSSCTRWDAFWISRITALESALSGQETTMKPTNLRLHSRASRLISRACVGTQGYPHDPSLLHF